MEALLFAFSVCRSSHGCSLLLRQMLELLNPQLVIFDRFACPELLQLVPLVHRVVGQVGEVSGVLDLLCVVDCLEIIPVIRLRVSHPLLIEVVVKTGVQVTQLVHLSLSVGLGSLERLLVHLGHDVVLCHDDVELLLRPRVLKRFSSRFSGEVLSLELCLRLLGSLLVDLLPLELSHPRERQGERLRPRCLPVALVPLGLQDVLVGGEHVSVVQVA